MLDRRKLFSDKRALLCLGCSALFAGFALFVSISSSGAVGSTAAARGVKRFGGSLDGSAGGEFRLDRDWRLGGASWREEARQPEDGAPLEVPPAVLGEEVDPMAEQLQGLDFAVQR